MSKKKKKKILFNRLHFNNQMYFCISVSLSTYVLKGVSTCETL